MSTLKDGRSVSFRRLRAVRGPGTDRGWIDHRVEGVVDGRSVGRLTITWIPDVEKWTMEDFEEVQPSAKRDEGRFESFKTFHGRPYVAGVYVDESYRRKGLGTLLYREAAQWLAEVWGLPLRSGDPNEFSRPLWESLIAQGEPVTQVDVGRAGFRHSLRYVVDKRQEQPALEFLQMAVPEYF